MTPAGARRDYPRIDIRVAFGRRMRTALIATTLGAFVLASMAASMVLMAFLHTEKWQVVLWPVLFGLGMAWSVLGSAKLILEAVPHGDTAVSAGVMGVGRSIGSGAAVPVLGAIWRTTSTTPIRPPGRSPTPTAGSP